MVRACDVYNDDGKKVLLAIPGRRRDGRSRYYVGPDRNIATGISARDRSFVKGGCKQGELISSL